MIKKNTGTEWDRYGMTKKEYEVICAAGQRVAHELIVLDEQYGEISDIVLGSMDIWRAMWYERPAFYALEMIFRVTKNGLACKILNLIEELNNVEVTEAFLDAFQKAMESYGAYDDYEDEDDDEYDEKEYIDRDLINTDLANLLNMR